MGNNVDNSVEQKPKQAFDFKGYILNTAIQYALFIAPFLLIYLIWYRNDYMIHHFFGLKSFPVDQWYWIPLLLLAQIPMLISSLYAALQADYNWDDERIHLYRAEGFGLKLVAHQILFVIRTALLEEMIFRGAMINTVQKFASGEVANHVQAILFTALHVIPLVQQKFKIHYSIIITATIYAFCYFSGWIMLNPGQGSVVASIISHSILNWISTVYIIKVGNKRLPQS